MNGTTHDPGTPSGGGRRAGLGVVVGYDGSGPAQAAVRWAAAQAVGSGRPLQVVHVVDFTGVAIDVMAPHVDDWPRPALEAGRAIADEGAALAARAAPGVDVHATLLSGGPTEMLVEESRRADLLVLGTRGRSDFAAVCLGSVSTAAAAHAFCPVVIVRGSTTPIPGPAFPVVVGVDGSSASDRAVDVAADVAAQARAALHVMSVWAGVAEETSTIAYPRAVSPGFDHVAEAAHAEADRAAERAVGRARQRHPRLDVDRVVVEGRPAPALVAAGKGVGLLVVGSRGRGAFTGLVLGSVSHGVVHAAPCPVMVVRSPRVRRPHEHDEASMHVIV